MHSYDELSIRITPSSIAGTYAVVAWGAAGDESGEFVVPFEDLEVDNFVLRVGRTRRNTRRLQSPEMAHAKEFGGRLFDALFQDRVRDIYRRSREMATDAGKGIRLSLKLSGAPELLNLPWEYLFDEPDFLSISTQTPIVRYLDLPARRRPLAVEPPLQILGMVSNPEESVPLAVDDERTRLETALGPLREEGLVEVRWSDKPTLQALQRQLRGSSYHVFHFIGHGGFDEQSQDGLLLLEDEHQRSRPVSGWQLGTILGDHTSLRLAVLNACEGARSAIEDPFAGVATSLVQREIPAVIAMQFEITDRAAVIFAEELYAALAHSYPVDAALAEARKAIFADGNDIEWGTPTLFMRVPDGRIFTVEEPGDAQALRGGMGEIAVSGDGNVVQVGDRNINIDYPKEQP